MRKPATMLISDFREQINKVVNSSELPWWKIQDEIELILLPRLRALAEKERQAELEAYLKEQEKQNELEEKRQKRIGEKGDK